MESYGNDNHWSRATPNDQTSRSGEAFPYTPGHKLGGTRSYLFGGQKFNWSDTLPYPHLYGGHVTYGNNQLGDAVPTHYQPIQQPEFGFYWSLPSPALSTTLSPTKQRDKYYMGAEPAVSTPFCSPPPEHVIEQIGPHPRSMVSLEYPHTKIQHHSLPNPHRSTADDMLLQPVPSNFATVPNLPETAEQSNSLCLAASEWCCKQCNKYFVSQTGLKHHNLARHTGVRPHRCVTCGKRFSELVQLQRHILRHDTQTKPYKCDHCPKSFCYRTDLRRHEYRHTANKPFNCSICAKGFARQDHMRKHELTHQKQKRRKKVLKTEDCTPIQDG
uniref:C2H2-type domain-containing protein n=1 Tax=Anopheles funestus TaxID=62324 RepID=A0A182RUC6_ANOFN